MKSPQAMKYVCMLLWALFFWTVGWAQPTLADVLIGEWTGALEYLDYQDNTSRVSLPTDLSIQPKKETLRLRYAYVEPNGKIVRGKDQVTYSDEKVKWGGEEWEIQSVEGKSVAEGWEMVLIRNGRDDDRPAILRQTIRRKNDELTVLKEVQYEGADTFSFRNVYRFGKKAGPVEK
jgi:hypothetical protein